MKDTRLFLLFLGSCSLVAFLLASESAHAQVQVNIDSSVEHQIMDGVAGNAYGYITNPAKYDPKALELITTDIHVTHIRFRSAINQWEPGNDNGDPYSINWSAFQDWKSAHEDFVLMQALTQAGIECILGIWEVPDWMVLNPGNNYNRIIPPHMYPEFAELIVSYILYAEQHYGARINIIGIQNEPNIGIANYFSPEELADVTEVVLSFLDLYGLDHIKLHVGDVNEPYDGVEYFTPSMDRPVIASRTLGVSFHTWHNMTSFVLEEIRDFAKNRGVQTWATEVGTSPLNPSTLDWALGSMKNHHLSLKYANSSLTFQWTLGGADSAIDKYGNIFPIYHALKHYHQHVYPGSVRIDSSGDTGSLFTTAFVEKTTKTLTVVTINTDYSGQYVTYNLTAPDKGYNPLTVYKTSSMKNYEMVGTQPVNPDDTFDYYVEGRSFHTFSGHYNSIPSVILTQEPSAGYPLCWDYTLYLTDEDGIALDLWKAGIAFFLDDNHFYTQYYDDPNPPAWFKVSFDPSGKTLIMEMLHVPEDVGITIVGGGVDKDGGIALVSKEI